MDHLIFDEDERRNPTSKELKNWKRYGDYMARMAPEQLKDVRILTGAVPNSVLVNAVIDRSKEDVLLEKLTGDREKAVNYYSALPQTHIGQYDATYHPLANAVILNEASPAALVHELGHSIDMSREKDKSNFNRWLRNSLKPTLVKEVKAWNKGTDALRHGFVSSKDANKIKRQLEIIDVLSKSRKKKYPALGSYFGGSLGALGGAIGGVATGIPYGGLLGSLLGGTVGAIGGAGGGRLLAGMMQGRHKRKEERLLRQALEKQLLSA
jgi:hypothetical protein